MKLSALDFYSELNTLYYNHSFPPQTSNELLFGYLIGINSTCFISTGDQPSTEEIEGPYPTVVLGPTGKNVLIVQAYAYGKFTGILHVNFDVNLDVQSWSGNPILLDNTITQGNLKEKRGWELSFRDFQRRFYGQKLRIKARHRWSRKRNS